MSEGKCPQVRTTTHAKGDVVACPSCGRSVRVVEFRRTEGMIPFLPAHATEGQGRPVAAFTAPHSDASVVVGRVAVPVQRPRVRSHEWVEPGNGIACRRGKSCGHWGSEKIFAVCRRCGLCWIDAEALECAGREVRFPDAVLIADAGAVV